jgi:hypothetical protein
MQQTFRVNLKALELAKKIQWEFYTSSHLVYDEVTVQKLKVRFLTCQTALVFGVIILDEGDSFIFHNRTLLHIFC